MLYVSLAIIFVTIFFMCAVAFDWIELHVSIGPYYIHHWLSWAGILFVALFTPFYYWRKRNKPSSIKNLLKIHNIGNLIAFMFVSIHFTQQVTRPPQFYPDLGTGVGLYGAMSLLVVTGFFLRFGLVAGGSRKFLRVIHVLAVVSFYLVIVYHALHGFGII